MEVSWQESEGSVWELRVVSTSQPIRNWGPESYKHKKIISSNDLNKLGSRSLPRLLQVRMQLTDTVIAAW